MGERYRAAGDEVTADVWFRYYGVAPPSDFLAGGLAGAASSVPPCPSAGDLTTSLVQSN